MFKNKKIVVGGILAALVVVASLGGVALAEDGDTTTPKTLSARVAEILGLEEQKVADALTQAHSEMQTDRMQDHLKKMVEEGRITQEQADQHLAWMQSKPDMSPYHDQMKAWMETRPNVPEEMKAWMDAKPDMPMPGGQMGGRHGVRGMRGMNGINGMNHMGAFGRFGGAPVPAQPTE